MVISVARFSSQLVGTNKNSRRNQSERAGARGLGTSRRERERELSRNKRGPGTGYYFCCVSYPRNINGFRQCVRKT